MSQVEIEVSPIDRYKDTPAFVGSHGAQYALFNRPVELDGSVSRQHVVSGDEVGFLDKLAVRYYGNGQESLWFAIALANGIVSPEFDMFVGQVLVIPPRERMMQFIARNPS